MRKTREMSEHVARWFAQTDLTWAELEAEQDVLRGLVFPRLRQLVEPRGYTVVNYVDALEEALFENEALPDQYDLDRLPALDADRTGTADVVPLVYVRTKNRYDHDIDAALAEDGIAPMKLHDDSLVGHMAGLERGNYAAAIDPVGKYVHMADRGLARDLDWMATCWGNTTTITYPVTVRGVDVDAATVKYVE